MSADCYQKILHQVVIKKAAWFSYEFSCIYKNKASSFIKNHILLSTYIVSMFHIRCWKYMEEIMIFPPALN